MPFWVRFINSILPYIGRKVVRSCVGFWSIKPGGGLYRTSIPVGWRLARRSEYEGLSDNATELDRFIVSEGRK
jgi:hypothetical protein